MSNRKILIGLVAGCLVVTLCACGVVLAAATAGWVYADRTGWLSSPTPRPTRAPNATARPAPTPNAATLAEMDALGAWVTQARGLAPNTAGVQRKFLSADEVQDRTLQDFAEDSPPEEIADSARALTVLGLLDPAVDLNALYLRLYSEGIAGFYDPDTGELVVVSDAGQLNISEKATYAHEYNHALQDQNYDLRGLGFSEEGWRADSEKAAAVQALLEGDATLLEEQYMATLSPLERLEYERIVNSQDISIYYEIPDYLFQDFLFPYRQGLEFVRRFYDAGGWARVDEVWRQPPASTEQILHPELYDAGDLPLPVARVALTDTLGSGWRELETNTMGEWYTYLILAYGTDSAARLDADQAQPAAAGWGGDAYAVYYQDAQAQTVLTLHTRWDTLADAEEFGAAFVDYADARFSRRVAIPNGRCWEGPELHCFFEKDAHTLWLAAPDQAQITALLALYPDLQP